jgi:hypothetical protein
MRHGLLEQAILSLFVDLAHQHYVDKAQTVPRCSKLPFHLTRTYDTAPDSPGVSCYSAEVASLFSEATLCALTNTLSVECKRSMKEPRINLPTRETRGNIDGHEY